MRPAMQNNYELAVLVASDLAPRLSLHMGIPPDEQDEVLDDVEEALHKCSSFDGYELGEFLDNAFGYSMDAEAVSILDSAYMIMSKYYRKLVVDWVKESGVKPRLKIGDLVVFKFNQKEVHGEIIDVKKETAEYTIYVEAFGHVKQGGGTLGIIQTWEEIDSKPGQ